MGAKWGQKKIFSYYEKKNPISILFVLSCALLHGSCMAQKGTKKGAAWVWRWWVFAGLGWAGVARWPVFLHGLRWPVAGFWLCGRSAPGCIVLCSRPTWLACAGLRDLVALGVLPLAFLVGCLGPGPAVLLRLAWAVPADPAAVLWALPRCCPCWLPAPC